MKKVLVLGFTVLLLINCTQNGLSDDAVPEPVETDKVLAVDDSYEVVENSILTLSDFLSNVKCLLHR